MQNQKEKERLIVESGVFEDLSEPVIAASGNLLRYFLKAEKLTFSDTSFIERLGNDPSPMIAHALELERENHQFRSVIDDLVEMVEPLLYKSKGLVAVAGGQRRDWVFSGLVARRLFVPHIALFGNGEVELYNFDGGKKVGILRDYEAVPVSDSMTSGSSAYDTNGDTPAGWVVQLRGKEVTVQNYVTVVDRKMGGREALQQAGVTLHSWFEADDDFLRRQSNCPEKAIASRVDAQQFTRDYLREGDLGCLVRFFDPGGKISHGRKFIRSHGTYLREIDRFDELNTLVATRYGKGIDELIGGNQK